MGWALATRGIRVLILDRARFPREKVCGDFVEPRGLRREDVSRWILHPGGQRIIEVMAEELGLARADLAPTEAVLAEHGNMSSVTVLFVLEHMLREGGVRPGERGVLGAFGPGFGAEFALLEFL